MVKVYRFVSRAKGASIDPVDISRMWLKNKIVGVGWPDEHYQTGAIDIDEFAVDLLNLSKGTKNEHYVKEFMPIFKMMSEIEVDDIVVFKNAQHYYAGRIIKTDGSIWRYDSSDEAFNWGTAIKASVAWFYDIGVDDDFPKSMIGNRFKTVNPIHEGKGKEEVIARLESREKQGHR